jgi:hypothetical protein
MILYEDKTSSSYVGGYSGASIRVAKGIYYHFGGMQGHRVQTSSLQEIDYGQALITTQNFYFGAIRTTASPAVVYLTRRDRSAADCYLERMAAAQAQTYHRTSRPIEDSCR